MSNIKFNETGISKDDHFKFLSTLSDYDAIKLMVLMYLDKINYLHDGGVELNKRLDKLKEILYIENEQHKI